MTKNTPEQALQELQAKVESLESERAALAERERKLQKQVSAAQDREGADLELVAKLRAELAELREVAAESVASRQAVELDLLKLKDKRVWITIPFGSDELGKRDVTVGINGEHYQIKRNVKVAVPGFLLGVLNDATEDVYPAGIDERTGELHGLGEPYSAQRIHYIYHGLVEEGARS